MLPTMKLSLVILSAVMTLPTLYAYTNGLTEMLQRAFQPKPKLDDFSHAFVDTTLSLKLRVGDEGALAISNLKLQLLDNSPLAADAQHPMPGYNGPHPNTSGGVSSIGILSPGDYIDLAGMKHLDLSDQASWEIVWRKDAPAGALICALEVLSSANRNHAQLNAGRIYISFPIWTADTLLEYQEHKENCEKAVAEYLYERDDQLHKMQQTNNLLAKALHYRNAAAAVEKYSLQPIHSMARVPTDDDVIAISDDLFLTQAGTVWTKFTGSAFLGTRKQVLLGTAVASKDT